MSPSKIAAFVCVLAADQSAAFSPSHMTNHVSPLNPPALAMSATQFNSEDEAAQLLRQASVCAHSDSCSIDTARDYLREIVHIQSGCAAGTLNGNFVCEDVLYASEVVADLREKLKEGLERESRTFWEQRQDEFEALVSSSVSGPSGLSPTAALLQAPLKPTYLAIAALYAATLVSLLPNTDANLSGVVPFQPQEVWWAIRDGYVVDLASHWIRNGGLSLSDDAASPAPLLSAQETWWAIRDAYFHNAAFGSADFKNDSAMDVVDLKPKEMFWALQNGYAGDMIAHFLRNGGLLA